MNRRLRNGDSAGKASFTRTARREPPCGSVPRANQRRNRRDCSGHACFVSFGSRTDSNANETGNTEKQFRDLTILTSNEDDVKKQHREQGVKDMGYYEEAVRWAYENGITTGTSKTKFSPDKPVTRGQMVVFLQRLYDLLKK